jgi:hypothetical protein
VLKRRTNCHAEYPIKMTEDSSQHGSLRSKLLELTAVRYRELINASTTLANVDDGTALLLKCHLLVERTLEELIRVSFYPNADAILALNLKFAQKITLVSKTHLADGFPLVADYAVGSLRKLNKLRNDLAHSLDATVSNVDVVDLFCGEEDRLPYGDISEDSISENLQRYLYFILGTLLPKYEIENGE